jgi:Trk K+ transport system NAD-binding subunit/uncharacterized membrane protein YuzA (DUF378 family)
LAQCGIAEVGVYQPAWKRRIVLGAIILLLSIVLLSLLVNRVATVALTFTGMSKEMARFQARSAFSTCGFTTAESESVVNNPVRRRIIMLLMLMGSVGFVGVVATSLATFSGEHEHHLAVRIGYLVAGLAGLWAVAMSQWVDDQLFRFIGWAIGRFTELEVQDFVNLLQLGPVYSVTEMRIEEGDWLVGQRLDELRLNDIGINVLSIHRADGQYEGNPTGATYVRRGDRLIIYGARDNIVGLDKGRSDPEAGLRHRAEIEERRAQWRKHADAHGEGYAVMELVARKKGWLAGKRLDELRLGDVGINVLGIKRVSGEYLGTPTGTTRIQAEDTLVVYGTQQDIQLLEETRSDPDGEQRHRVRAMQRRAEQPVADPEVPGDL